MKVDEIGCWSDALFMMEKRGFSKEDAAELALQIFNWGIRAAFDRMRPSRPLPADLPPQVHEAAAQIALLAENDPPSASIGQSKQRAKNGPKMLKRTIPDDFQITDARVQYAMERGFKRPAAEEMFGAFRDWYRMSGKQWSDWEAVWRDWVRRQVDKLNQQRSDPDRPGGFL